MPRLRGARTPARLQRRARPSRRRNTGEREAGEREKRVGFFLSSRQEHEKNVLARCLCLRPLDLLNLKMKQLPTKSLFLIRNFTKARCAKKETTRNRAQLRLFKQKRKEEARRQKKEGRQGGGVRGKNRFENKRRQRRKAKSREKNRKTEKKTD